jgi:pilus assembly protein CpaB
LPAPQAFHTSIRKWGIVAVLRGNTRLIAIGVAVLLAGVATFALFAYMRGFETRTQEQFEPVDAFVATDVITAGTHAEAATATGLIAPRPVPASAIPSGAITSLTQIEGRVAVTDIQPGEVILAARFAETVQTVQGLRAIPEDRQAISVQVGIPPGVAGFITSGAEISLIAHISVESEDGEADFNHAQFLLQGVEVLAVGRRVVAAEGEQVQQTEQILLTLAVTAEEAEKVDFAVFNGDLNFT